LKVSKISPHKGISNYQLTALGTWQNALPEPLKKTSKFFVNLSGGYLPSPILF